MLGSMSPNGPNRPRIGIPWRTSEEGRGSVSPWRGKNRYYAEAVERAGGEPVELSLADSGRLKALLPSTFRLPREYPYRTHLWKVATQPPWF